MFRSKKQVDKYVADFLARCRGEHEKKLGGFKFAKLYTEVKDYESARKYLAAYLTVHGDNPTAHKLMGDIQAATERPYAAIESFKRSLDLDESQKDVFLRICKIYANLPADRQAIQYWLEQAEDSFPGHSIVLKLKERMARTEGVPDVKEMEDAITSEIMENPLDVPLRVKLLQLLLDTGRALDAYVQALEAEEQPEFNVEATYSLLWQRCVTSVMKACHRDEAGSVDEFFLTKYLLTLDQLASLTLHNPNSSALYTLPASTGMESNRQGEQSALEDAVSAVGSLDILLKEAHRQQFSSGAWNFVLQHVTAQLYLHVATLVLKMPMKVDFNWQEAHRWAASLLVLACTVHPPCALSQEDWFLALRTDRQSLYYNVFLRAHHRLSVSGHILQWLCDAEDKSSWLSQIKKEACTPEVRNRIYQSIFDGKGSTSWFLQDTSLISYSSEFPSPAALHKHDQESQWLHPASLDHLAWLKLQWSSLWDKKRVEIGQPFEVHVFEELPLEPHSFKSGAIETLSQLDMMAFLEATCYCASQALSRKAFHPIQGPLVLPPHVGMQLCTDAQANWWRAAHHLCTKSAMSKRADLRSIMRRGLEVVRAIGNHGMDLTLVVHLARTFSKKSSLSCADGLEEEAKAFENQAAHYWEAVLAKLETHRITGSSLTPSGRLFCVPAGCAVTSLQELREIKQEAKMFLATFAMNAGYLDVAAKMFSGLTTARAAYYTALVMKRTSERKSPQQGAHDALLQKEQVALQLALERSCRESDWTLASIVSAHLDDLQERMNSTSETSGFCDDSNGDRISSPSWLQQTSTPKPDKSFFLRRTPPKKFPTVEATPEAPSHQPETAAAVEASITASENLGLRLRTISLHQKLEVSRLHQMQEASQSMIREQLDSHKNILAEVKQQKTIVEQLMKKVDEVAVRTAPAVDATPNSQHQSEGSEQSNEQASHRGPDSDLPRCAAAASSRTTPRITRGPRCAAPLYSAPCMQNSAYGNYPMSHFGCLYTSQPFFPPQGITATTNIPIQGYPGVAGQLPHDVRHPPPSTLFASGAPSHFVSGNMGQTLAIGHSVGPQAPAPVPQYSGPSLQAMFAPTGAPAVPAVPDMPPRDPHTFQFPVPATTISTLPAWGGGDGFLQAVPPYFSASSFIAPSKVTGSNHAASAPQPEAQVTTAALVSTPGEQALFTAVGTGTRGNQGLLSNPATSFHNSHVPPSTLSASAAPFDLASGDEAQASASHHAGLQLSAGPTVMLPKLQHPPHHHTISWQTNPDSRDGDPGNPPVSIMTTYASNTTTLAFPFSTSCSRTSTTVVAPSLFESTVATTAAPAQFRLPITASRTSLAAVAEFASSFSTPEMVLTSLISQPRTNTKTVSTQSLDLHLPTCRAEAAVATSLSLRAPSLFGPQVAATTTSALSLDSVVVSMPAVPVIEATELSVPTSSFSTPNKLLQSYVFRPTTDTSKAKSTFYLPSCASSTTVTPLPFLGSKPVITATRAPSFALPAAASTALVTSSSGLPTPTSSKSATKEVLAPSILGPTTDAKETSALYFPLLASSAASVVVTSYAANTMAAAFSPSTSCSRTSRTVIAPSLCESTVATTAAPQQFCLPITASRTSLAAVAEFASSFSTPEMVLTSMISQPRANTKTVSTQSLDLQLPTCCAEAAVATSLSLRAPSLFGPQVAATATSALSLGSVGDSMSAVPVTEATELSMPTSSFSAPNKLLQSCVFKPTTDTSKAKSTLHMPSCASSTTVTALPFLGSKLVITATRAPSFALPAAASTALVTSSSGLPTPTSSKSATKVVLAPSILRPTTDTKETSALLASSAASVVVTSYAANTMAAAFSPSTSWCSTSRTVPQEVSLSGSETVATATPSLSQGSVVAAATAAVTKLAELSPPTSSFSISNLVPPSSAFEPTTDTTKTVSALDLPLCASSTATVTATSLLGSKTITTTTAPSFGFPGAAYTAPFTIPTEILTPTSSFGDIKLVLATLKLKFRATTDTKGTSSSDLPLLEPEVGNVMATSLSSGTSLPETKTVSTASTALLFRSPVAASTVSEVSELMPTSSCSSQKLLLVSSVSGSTIDTNTAHSLALPLSRATVLTTSLSAPISFCGIPGSTSATSVLEATTASTMVPAMKVGLPVAASTAAPFSLYEKNGMEETIRDAGCPALISSCENAGISELSTTHPEPELLSGQVSYNSETETCKPQSHSTHKGSSALLSVEKNGAEEAVLPAYGQTAGLFANNDNTSKHSHRHPEPELPRGKVSTSSETAVCQPQLYSPHRGPSPLPSVEKNGAEEAISPANGQTCGLFTDDDNVRKFSLGHSEPELSRCKVSAGSEAGTCLFSIPIQVAGSSPLFSVGKNSTEEAKPAVDGPALASYSSGDDVSKLRHPESEFPRAKVSADSEIAPFQPSLDSPVTVSSHFSSRENGGMEAVVSAHDSTSASSRDVDNTSKLSDTKLEPELRRGETSNDSKAATCQPPSPSPFTGSTPLSSVEENGMEEAVPAADGSASSGDDDGNVNHRHLEAELARTKVSAGFETATCPPLLLCPVSGTSPSSSVEKNGMKETVLSADGLTCDSSSNVNNASKLSGTHLKPKLSGGKASADSETVTSRPPLPGPFSDLHPFLSDEKNGMEGATPAHVPALGSSSGDDNDNKLSISHPQPALQRAKMPTGSKTAACWPPLPSSVTGTSPSCSIEKSGLEEAKPALDGPASASRSNDDDNVGKPRQLVAKLPRRKVSADLETGRCQPPLPSPDEKNGMEAVPNTKKPTSASPRDDDNASELSNTYQEPEIRGEELSAGSKTATRQQPLWGAVTGSLPLSFVQSSGTEEAVHTADALSAASSSGDDNAIKLSRGKVSADSEMATCQSPPVLPDKVNDAEQAVPAADGQTLISYNNDVSELSTACPETELTKGKVLTSSEKPVYQPPLPIPLPRSSLIPLVKNGTGEATPSADGQTSILSSSDHDGNTRKHSSRWPELPRRKVSNDLGTATHQPPPVTGSSHIYSGGMNMQNGMENATPAGSDRAAISPSDDGDSSMLTSEQQEPEKPVFVFGVTLPSGKQMSAIAAVHVGTTSGKNASVTCGICGGQNVKEVSCQLTESGGLLSISPQDLEETSEELEQASSFAALATVNVEPTLSSSVSSPFMSCQENEPAEAPSAGKLNMSVSISPGGAANMGLFASTSQVFEFGVTLPNRKEPAPPNSPFHGVVNSGKNVFSVNMSSSPQGYNTISKNKATSGTVVGADVEKEEFCSSRHENKSTVVEHTDLSDIQTPHEQVAGHKLQSDEKTQKSPEDLPHGRLSDQIKKLCEHLRKSKDVLTTSSPSNAHPETSAELFTFGSPSASSTHQSVDLSPEARPSTSTTRPSTTTIFRSSLNLAASTPVAAAQSLSSQSPTAQSTMSESGYTSSFQDGSIESTSRDSGMASHRAGASRGRARRSLFVNCATEQKQP